MGKIDGDISGIKKQVSKIKSETEKKSLGASHTISTFALFMVRMIAIGVLVLGFFFFFEYFAMAYSSFMEILLPLASGIMGFTQYSLILNILFFFLLFVIVVFILPITEEAKTGVLKAVGAVVILVCLVIGVIGVFQGDYYEVNAGEITAGFNSSASSLMEMFDNIGCYMDFQCARKMRNKDESEAVEEMNYELSVSYRDIFKGVYRWDGGDIEVPFNMRIRAEGEKGLYVKKYECYFRPEKEEGLFESGGEGEKIDEKEVDKEVNTKGRDYVMSGECKIPAERVNSSLEIGEYKLGVKVYSEGRSTCEYPFYVVNFRDFVNQNNINFQSESADSKIYTLKAQYSSELNNVFEEDIGNANFLCTNDLFKVTSHGVDQPFFSGVEGERDKSVKFDFTVKKNKRSDVGSAESAKIVNFRKPRLFEVNEDDSINLVSEEDSYGIEHPSFDNNKVDFLLAMSLRDSVERTMRDSLRLEMRGDFVRKEKLNLKIKNMNYEGGEKRETNETSD